MRQVRVGGLEVRASALWGKSGKGSRASALWGGKRVGQVALTVFALCLAVVPLASAAASPGAGAGASYLSPALLAQAAAHPGDKLDVIVQSTAGADAAAGALQSATGTGALKKLALVNGVSARIPAARLGALAKVPGLSVTPDAPSRSSGSALYSNNQVWPFESGAAKLWPTANAPGPVLPAIAIVDTGVDATRAADFGTRILASVNFSSTTPTAVGDGRGHGTFVAGIAAGQAPGYAGAAPSAPIVSLRVFDDRGVAKTSDIITACQWILQNKARYNIRVANFSLHSAMPSHFVNDPLDQAVEKLWFNGVTVVAAAGNYGVNGQPVRVGYAPGNDPFVITVGAEDLNGNVGLGNDFAAPWSAYGYTYDGFYKPELAAPGRYMVGPIPATSTLAQEKAANIVAPGYIQLSGTSFAAPVASAAAAYALANHPGWTPDQVKGALMVSAQKAPNAAPGSLGVGELNIGQAVSVKTPPNPNAALDGFLGTDANGATVFDGTAWENTARTGSNWTSSNWTDSNWTSAAWWTSSNWVDSNWTASNWTDSNWTDSNWTDASATDSAYEDAAEGDATTPDAYTIDSVDLQAILADPLFTPSDPASLPADTTTTTTSSGSLTTGTATTVTP